MIWYVEDDASIRDIAIYSEGAHHDTLQLNSAPGRGTKITVIFPKNRPFPM